MLKVYRKIIWRIMKSMQGCSSSCKGPVYAILNKAEEPITVYYIDPYDDTKIYMIGSYSSLIGFEECSWLEVLVTTGLIQDQIRAMIKKYTDDHILKDKVLHII